jgi:hypothetical protein
MSDTRSAATDDTRSEATDDTRSSATDDTRSAATDDWSILDQIASELTDIYDLHKKDWNFDSENNYDVIQTIHSIMMSDNTKLKNKVRILVKEEMSDIVWCYWRNYIKYADDPPEYNFEYEIKKKEEEFWSKLSDLM